MIRYLKTETVIAAGILIACLTALLAGAKPAEQEKLASYTSAVRIENNHFVRNQTGEPFVPRGFNYVRLDLEGRGGHANFSPYIYDREQAQTALRHMAENGYNVVRVFINGLRGQRGCMFTSRDAQAPNPAYLDNLADFLLMAREQDVLVVLCFDFFPQAGPYRIGLNAAVHHISGELNNHYLNPAHIDAKKRYVQDVIRELRDRDPKTLSAVFCWDIMNELCYQLGVPPFSLDKGRVTPANGVTYDLATEKTRLADDMAIYWVDAMASAIRKEIPDALINANVFTYSATGRAGPGDFSQKTARWQNRYPFRPTALLRSSADIIDIHFYARDNGELNQDLASIEHEQMLAVLKKSPSKALLVGEFGVFKDSHPKLGPASEWVAHMAERFPELGFAGWLYWTYDTHEQERLWNAMDSDGFIFNRLPKP